MKQSIQLIYNAICSTQYNQIQERKVYDKNVIIVVENNELNCLAGPKVWTKTSATVSSSVYHDSTSLQ